MGTMSELEQRLRTDLVTAMKARDEVVVATLRMALTAVTTEGVAGSTARELTDEDVVAVLTREAKRRREAATAFDAAARPELAARERAELAVLTGYLPEQVGPGELAALVTAAVARAAAAGQTGPRAMGVVMKDVQSQVRGRADGAAVAALVRAELGMA